MGLESVCRVTHRGASWDARVMLETDELRVRGERPLRVPLAGTTATATNGVLHLAWGDDALAIELGAAAAKWASRITAPPSVLDKLGVKPGSDVVAITGLDAALLAELGARAAVRLVERGDHVPAGAALVFLQAATRDALAPLHDVAARMARDGAVWVVHPKGKDGLPDTVVFEVGKGAGLTAVKVARISDALTAERLVIPKAAR